MNVSKATVVTAAIVIGIAAGLAAQKRDKAPGPLVIKSQGSFFVGGEKKAITQPGFGPNAQPTTGNITVNQMYVQYQIPPKGDQHVPVVMVHGCCLSSKTWETTPDGRMGWSEYFVRKDRSVYLADQVSRARSGFDPTAFADARQGKTPAAQMPNILDATHQVAWTVFRFGPKYGEAFPDGQFPVEAADELYKQMIPDLNSTLPAVNPTWTQMAALGVKLKGAVLMGHSESGFFPEQAALIDPSGIRGNISIEMPCATDLTAAQIGTLAKIPTLIMFGDHLGDVTGGPANWAQSFATCNTFVDQLKKAGGDAEMMHLPAMGIKGNSHMLMQDRNSDQLADLVIAWIDKHVEAGEEEQHEMRSRIALTIVVTAIAALPALASAQWPNHLPPGVPKTADGKPNLTAPAPRMPDGKPDLSGLWQNGPTGLGGAPSSDPNAPPAATFFNIGSNMKGGLPLRPWAAELLKQRNDDHSKDNPDAHCLPMGLLQFHEHPQPRKIVQTQGLVVIIYEANYGLRQIFLDGRPLPSNDPQPWWYGYSAGKWEGDTLVVETTGLRDGGWLDIQGSPLTDQAKITERIRRPNFGTLITDVTIDDPKAYTKPFTVRFTQDLVADGELIEFICNENEQSATHLLGKGEGPKTFNVSAQTFERYVGRYRTAAGMEVAITRDGTRFFGQMFGLPPFEIFASSEREFFLTSFDARMTFQVDGAGRATALVLHMGDDQVATRVP